LFVTVDDFQARYQPHAADGWLRFSVPINLREAKDRRLPAANVMSMVFLDRRRAQIADPDRLLASIHHDLELSRRLRLQLGDANLAGALVIRVNRISNSFEAGLRRGDVIQEINHQPVRTADDAVKLTEHAGNRKTLLKLWSHGSTHFLVVDETDGKPSS